MQKPRNDHRLLDTLITELRARNDAHLAVKLGWPQAYVSKIRNGKIDWPGVEKLAAHLVANGHDGIAVNGTTGEAPTTKSSEKEEIIRVVKDVVGPKIFVVSGAGDNETDYSINQAKRTEKAGADGLLIVAPYYNKPPQAGVAAHFKAIASATDLPVMMYDIPGRCGIEIEPDTIVSLYEHPQIVALKDAKGNVASTSWVVKRCGIPVYSGDDILNLPLLSVGAVGMVSVCGHTVGKDLKAMLDAWFAGNAAKEGTNLMPPVIEAVEAYCTLGEISDTLRTVFGEYQS